MKNLRYKRAAGIIPFRRKSDVDGWSYLLIHSAVVRNPRARWEFPKGGIGPGETPRRAAAAREFEEEAEITAWTFQDGFGPCLSSIYMWDGLWRSETITYFMAEVFDDSAMSLSRIEADEGSSEALPSESRGGFATRRFAESSGWPTPGRERRRTPP